MLNRIKRTIGKVLEDPSLEASLSDNADLVNDVGLDSLQMIDFILSIEDEFGIELDFDNLTFNHMRSIRQFGDFIEIQINARENTTIEKHDIPGNI